MVWGWPGGAVSRFTRDVRVTLICFGRLKGRKAASWEGT